MKKLCLLLLLSLAVPSLAKAVSCDGAFTLLGLVGDQNNEL
jgi:hypothetical protein